MEREEVMGLLGKERRRFERRSVIEIKIDGIFYFKGGNQELITARIINISEGGLSFVLKKDENKEAVEGKHLILKEIKGAETLQSITDLELEIKWIVVPPSFDNFGIGCEFINASEKVRAQLRQFVHSK
jgi:c-di-GMP-binding flagellar brake protein YcgR